MNDPYRMPPIEIELRDWIALTVLSQLHVDNRHVGQDGADQWARWAYLVADAMMKARISR